MRSAVYVFALITDTLQTDHAAVRNASLDPSQICVSSRGN